MALNLYTHARSIGLCCSTLYYVVAIIYNINYTYIHMYIYICTYIRMRYYNVNIYLQQLVPVSFWALFIICFLAHFSITDPSVCPRVSFSSLCLFVFWLSLLLFPNSESKWYLFGIIFFIFEETPRRRRCHCAVVCPRPHRTLTHRSFDILIFCFFVLISV